MNVSSGFGRSLALAILASTLLLGACAATPTPPGESPGGTGQASAAPSPTGSDSQPGPTASDVEIPGIPVPTAFAVQVFFSKRPASENDPAAVFPVERMSPDLGVGAFAIKQLLLGPTAAEQNQGYFSVVQLRAGASNCGGADFKLNIAAGVATLQFCRTFDHRGSFSDGQAESTLNATLKQFPSVSKVVILNSSGNCEFDLSGLNRCKQ